MNFPSVRGGQGLSKGRQGRGERGGWLEAWNKGAGAWGGSLRAWGARAWTGPLPKKDLGMGEAVMVVKH